MKNSRFLPILAASVAAGSSIRDAAQAAGCSESNAYTISRTPEFKTQVAAIRNDAIAAAVGVLGDEARPVLGRHRVGRLVDDVELTVGLDNETYLVTHP